MKRAIVSVSNKDGLEELAAALVSAGIEIISTGRTFRFLTDLSFPVIEISEYTSFPEMMDGRVKTLHPKVHGGILARRDLDLGALEENSLRSSHHNARCVETLSSQTPFEDQNQSRPFAPLQLPFHSHLGQPQLRHLGDS